MARKPSRDWSLIFQDFLAKKQANPSMTMMDYCRNEGINQTQFSRNTSKLRQTMLHPKQIKAIDHKIKEAVKEQVDVIVNDARQILKAASVPAAERIAAISRDTKDEGLAVKASTAILDRAGYAPQTANISANVNIQVPVLFSNIGQDDLTELRGSNGKAAQVPD